MYSQPEKTPDFKHYSEAEFESQVKTTQSWSRLTEIQKKVAYFHFLHPEKTKKELAELAGCTPNTVSNFFSSRGFDELSLIIHKQEVYEMRTMALKRMRQIIQTGTDRDATKLIDRLLTSEGVLRDEPLKTPDRDLKVAWGEEPKHGTTDSIQPPSEAA